VTTPGNTPMKRPPWLLTFLLLTGLLLATPPAAVRAQSPPGPPAFPPAAGAPAANDETDAGGDIEPGESARVVRELRAVKNKTLIFVFDVSASMLSKVGPDGDQNNLQRAREAAINLIREAAGPGDRLLLTTFGAGNQTVFDQTLRTEADKEALIEQVPSAPGQGAGTNIRKPHHDALKILDQSLPRPGAVVLLTDSFNDEPRKNDPAYATYLRYYTPGGRLTRYPDTPENRDYERLLAKMKRSQKVKIFGIGVQIDESGRPVERLPQAVEAEETPAAPVPTLAPAVATPKKDNTLLYVGLGLGAAALALLLLFLAQAARAVPLRIVGGPAGPKDFRLKSGQTVRLGGDGANFAHDAYPLPGLGAAPASVRGGRGGQFALVPGTLAAPGVEPPKVFHNGMPLEKETPLGYGDEVRVSVPDPASGVAKDFRLKFEDPSKSF